MGWLLLYKCIYCECLKEFYECPYDHDGTKCPVCECLAENGKCPKGHKVYFCSTCEKCFFKVTFYNLFLCIFSSFILFG